MLNRELNKLSDAEKINLIGKIRDSIEEPDLVPVPEKHKGCLKFNC